MKEYMSVTGIIILGLADLALVYYLFRDAGICMMALLIIWGIVEIEMFVTKISLQAIPADQYMKNEKEKLQRAYNAVADRVEQLENRYPKAKLYICNTGDLNAYNIGNAIIVEKMLLHQDQGTVKAVLAHEISHYLRKDSYFKALMEVNIILSAGLISLIGIVGVGLFFLLCEIAISCMLTKNRMGSRAVQGGNRMMKSVVDIAVKIMVCVNKIIAAMFYRRQEMTADAYAVKLGYGNQLKKFLEYLGNVEENNHGLLAVMLKDHPNTDKRMVNIEKEIMNQWET